MICNWKQQFDIQRFAEGGAAGGAAAAAGSAADAGQPGEGAGAGAQSAPFRIDGTPITLPDLLSTDTTITVAGDFTGFDDTYLWA